ncbi:MAG: NAD(+)/NADH kinase [Candidatus Thermoplasmatota archaeon]|nr:NAD(+)/NADH kinase [Candidatus Thermoplasmatota archaeon]
MKIQVVGLQKKALEKLIKEKYTSLELVDKKPEVVVSFGGDGTLLFAEREYPGVPKSLIRNSQVCKLCSTIVKETVLQLLQEEKFIITEYAKLEAFAQNRKVLALNDVVVGHPRINGTLRARVYIDKQIYHQEMFGDGVVISTPIGSTGYYQSITRSNFDHGIGIAFNNTVNIVSHLLVGEASEVEIEITRGPGIVAADNNEDYIEVSTGDFVHIKVSKERAKILQFPKEHERFNVNTSSNRVPSGYCQICRQHYER